MGVLGKPEYKNGTFILQFLNQEEKSGSLHPEKLLIQTAKYGLNKMQFFTQILAAKQSMLSA